MKEKYYDPMEVWNKPMSELFGKDKWDSLSYWQKMCEVAAAQKYFKESKNSISSIIGCLF